MGESESYIKKKALMGIENEFILIDNAIKEEIEGDLIYNEILEALAVPYFQKTEHAVRLATGGAFYIDGSEPEVTSAPYPIEKGAVTALVTNLIVNRNAVLNAIEKINDNEAGMQVSQKRANFRRYRLKGYSAHYNFSIGEIYSYFMQDKLNLLLAKTVNPVIQLLLENKHSSGVMFRSPDKDRIEICADYMPGLEDMVIGVGFQAAMLSAMNKWLGGGADFQDIYEKCRYVLHEPPTILGGKSGWILKTPDVIEKGRDALVICKDESIKHIRLCDTRTHNIKAQALLEHYCRIFEKEMGEVLTAQEKRLVMDAAQKKRKLPIDKKGYPRNYLDARPDSISQDINEYPLAAAFGNAVMERCINGITLYPQSIDWDNIEYIVSPQSSKIDSGMLRIPIKDLVFFEKLLSKHPGSINRLLENSLTEEDEKLLGAVNWEVWVIKTSEMLW